MSVFLSLFFIFILAAILTFISVYIDSFNRGCTEATNEIFGMQCRKIELSEIFDFPSLFSNESVYFYILLIRFIHYFITVIICFFIFIFDKKYDIYYVLYFCLLLLHWILFDECFLSKMEHEYSSEIFERKHSFFPSTEPSPKLLIQTYNGEGTRSKKSNLIHPHLEILFKENTDWFILFQAIMMIINITYILIFRFTPRSFDIFSNYPMNPIGRSPENFFSSTLRSNEKMNRIPRNVFHIKYRVLFTSILIATMSYLMLKDRIFQRTTEGNS
jgi:hypothetical protein